MAGIKDTSKWENRNCIECSITFEVYKKSKKIYCSKKCSNNSKSLIDIKNTTTKQTIEDKYGGIHYMNNKDTQLKHKQTMINRYGVKHALQNNNIIESMKKTCLDRYGVDNVSKHDVFIDKIKKTKLELYDDKITTRGTANGNLIGVARARTIEYNAGTAGETSSVYKLFMFDIQPFTKLTLSGVPSPTLLSIHTNGGIQVKGVTSGATGFVFATPQLP